MPSRSTGTRLACGALRSTDSCSIADTSSISAPLPCRASAFASVPPLVNTTSCGRALTRVATQSRASSTVRRAARPKPCTDDGLPTTASAAATAAAASDRTGAVAL
jgi:hypothetical protein